MPIRFVPRALRCPGGYFSAFFYFFAFNRRLSLSSEATFILIFHSLWFLSLFAFHSHCFRFYFRSLGGFGCWGMGFCSNLKTDKDQDENRRNFFSLRLWRTSLLPASVVELYEISDVVKWIIFHTLFHSRNLNKQHLIGTSFMLILDTRQVIGSHLFFFCCSFRSILCSVPLSFVYRLPRCPKLYSDFSGAFEENNKFVLYRLLKHRSSYSTESSNV